MKVLPSPWFHFNILCWSPPSYLIKMAIKMENFVLQGHQLSHAPERGIIFTNFSLVLQKISQAQVRCLTNQNTSLQCLLNKSEPFNSFQAGAYMCESSNRVGKGRSEDIVLDVKCKFYHHSITEVHYLWQKVQKISWKMFQSESVLQYGNLRGVREIVE